MFSSRRIRSPSQPPTLRVILSGLGDQRSGNVIAIASAFLAATPLSESDISAASGVCRTAGLRIAGFDERIISTEIAPFAGQRGSSRNVVGRTSARAIDCA